MAVESDLTGVVKTYNGVKGYGFITGTSLQQADVMFGRDALPEDAKEVQGHFMEGRQLIFDAQETGDGRWRATKVHIPYIEGKRVAGKIKSFSEKNGYGFITSSSLESDVHFKASVLPDFMPGMMLKDELVLFDAQSMPDGKLCAGKIVFQSNKIAMRMQGGEMGMGQLGMMGGMDMMSMMSANMMAANMMMPNMPSVPAPAAAATKRAVPVAPSSSMRAVKPKATFPVSTPSASSSPAGRGQANGVIKSYSDKNCYGFINIPGMPVDIKFGRHDLVGAMSVSPGTDVTFTCVQDGTGRFVATNVKPKGAAAGGMSAPRASFTGGGGGIKRPAPSAAQAWVPAAHRVAAASGMMPAQKMQRTQNAYVQHSERRGPGPEVGSGTYAKGTIKSYNSAKGFGFISSPGVPGDTFFGKSSLPFDAQEQPGQALQGMQVTFEIAQTPDGKVRALNVSFR